ncbi:helicase-related protein [Brachybacterium squillarum]|uniref:helicase-related protein n=1 Tax=Brachybacterium squillarum TaxID=661979 RepID=UPI000262941D|nr:helicase-related protein [Brachybacterium squillarum]
MEVFDNVSQLWGDDLRSELKRSSKVRIAASAFSIFAFDALRQELEGVDEVQFLFTSPAFPGEASAGKERRRFGVDHLNTTESQLLGTEFELRLRNAMTQRSIARECAEWIRRTARFHASTTPGEQETLTLDDSVLYTGFSGFTAPDLGYGGSGRASRYIIKDDFPQNTARFLDRFEQLWADPERSRDVTKEITDLVATVFAENSPRHIYFVILYNIFAEFLEDVLTDAMPDDRTGYRDSVIWKALYNFQEDAATGIINKLERYNGCILADSVGLGKTFTALAVIRYYELRNKDVLVLAPKKLSDNWTTFTQNRRSNPFAGERFRYDVLAHTDLQRERGSSNGITLDDFNWGAYDLVVIDESHNFRNAVHHEDRETRYDALLRKVIREGVRTKVLMLSATPVNNRFTDLRNQLALAYEGDTERFTANLPIDTSLDEVFRDAQAAFSAWSKLPAEERTSAAILERLDLDFFSLLDAVTIARSRKQVARFYDTSAIGAFPERRPPVSVSAPLSLREDAPGFEHIAAQLDTLTLATYTPLGYVLASRRLKYEELYGNVGAGQNRRSGSVANLGAHSRELGIRRLMTTNLLKRLESSIEAFRLTLRTVARRIDEDLTALEQGRAVEDDSEAIENWDDESEETELTATVGSTVAIDIADLDVISFRRDLETDRDVIRDLLAALEPIDADGDEKLRELMRVIDQKVKEPLNEGNRKVLVFSAFADTAEYLYQHVAPALERGGLNTALVTGTRAPKNTLGPGLDFSSTLTLFSPRSKKRDVLMPEETREIDVLIATDCISEGQNLQDCDMVVNYDIHWNPVRIVQRFGRVDRIGSTNSTIQLVNFWPDVDLDQYIHLVERVENRMRITDITATGDDNVLEPADSEDVAYRHEQLRRLKDEVIDLEDVRGGVSITDLGLNDVHLDLQARLREDPSIADAPKGLHAVVPADPASGLVPGVIFALRNVRADGTFQRGNRLHPHYLVYLDEQGNVVTAHTEVRRLLDLLRSACRRYDDPLPEAFEPFNEATADGAEMDGYSQLLTAAIDSMAHREEEDLIGSLFTAGPTAQPTPSLGGLDDFELTAFVAVVDPVQGGSDAR